MSRRLVLDLFCEDAGHEVFARALVNRLAAEAGLNLPELRARSARCGHGRAISELKTWQRFVRRDLERPGDALLVFIDGNGEGWANQRKAILKEVERDLFPQVVVGCPDPHVEVWCAADPEALRRLMSVELSPAPSRPGRGVYKRWLREALESMGEDMLDEPMQIASTLVPEMDLFKAGKAQPSLGAVITDLQALFKRAASTP